MSTLFCWSRKERRHRRERIEQGISLRDSWDLCAHLDEVILRGVRNLAENLHGCPSRLADECDGDVDEGCKRWRRILEEIAEGFEAELRAQANLEPSPPEFENAQHLLRDFWRDLWD